MPVGRPLMLALARQLDFNGAQSVGIVTLVAAIAGGGFVLIVQASLPLGISIILDLLTSMMVKLLAVVFTLLVVGARSLSAISAEMAMLQIRGERTRRGSEAGRSLLHLAWIRILAPALSGVILYLDFVVVALVAGALAARQSFDLWELIYIVDRLDPGALLLGALRTGLFMGLASAYVVNVVVPRARRFPDVPVAVSKGVLQGIVLMLLLELAYQLLAWTWGQPWSAAA